MVALSTIICARVLESASNVTSPPAKPLSPSAVIMAPSRTMIFCDSKVISPESPIDAPVRCAVALEEFETWREEIVTFCETVMLSSACRIRLPAFQVIELLLSDELVPPLATPVSRSISALISRAAGSISTVPCWPFWADADKDPPDRATTLRAENSTNPPSPELPPSADRRAPAARSLLFSAITRMSPPELFWP